MHNGIMVLLAAELTEAVEELAVAWVRLLAEPQQLSLAAAGTLATLSRSGARSIGELAAGEHVSQPAMTQLVDRLEHAGLVERRRGADDRRVVDVSITAAGQALLDRRRQLRSHAFASLFAALGRDDRAALAAAVPALRQLAALAREPDRRKAAA